VEANDAASRRELAEKQALATLVDEYAAKQETLQARYDAQVREFREEIDRLNAVKAARQAEVDLLTEVLTHLQERLAPLMR